MRQLTLDIAPVPEPTLQNFVTGANAQVLSALYAALGPVDTENGGERRLCLWGGPGSGKSHLLAACASASGGRFEACSGGSFIGDEDDTRLLALDDVDRLAVDHQIALFNLINRRGANNRSGVLLVSCSQPPAATGLRADLATRLAQGLALEVAALSDADKAAALAQHAKQRGIVLADDVTRYLLTHLARDLPTLVAVLDALDKLSLQLKRPITVPLVREVLQAPLDLDGHLEGNP
jgi:DnaA family protein